ncbi:ABC drug exporter AbcA [Penicillium daleae]|uniref:ABC drug exporter AbcA n=1 Tax=Penicillium daleae TaxID=63821 RepID=A0AAD6CEJ0_9EURO|nr:ABC drug exporter AbcA [Penicillium daleae]KAJ5460445.1 ABC drug exporter AbcA [Penicillium daleae]
MLLGGDGVGIVVKYIRKGLVYTPGLVAQTVCTRVIVVALDLAAAAFLTRESQSSTPALPWLQLWLTFHEGQLVDQNDTCLFDTKMLFKSISKYQEGGFQGSTSVFHWSNVCYDIKIKGKLRRILSYVDDWVKPGTLTALTGVSGAGKTTLRDCLADRRAGVGVLTGEMLVDGKLRDKSFQRRTGYAQQQDLHLETSTIRETLNFSALLRQPESVPMAEKLAYVDEVIHVLGMQEYADAIVGVPGEGLNVEQRKRLTIGVELAAKPPLLLFIDEPTLSFAPFSSPLPCYSNGFIAFSYLLKGARQCILVKLETMQRPSSITLSGTVPNLAHLVLIRGGRGGMLKAIGAAPGSYSEVDWHETWRSGPEYRSVQSELDQLRVKNSGDLLTDSHENHALYNEFATPLWHQLLVVTKHAFQQTWRTPSYIYSKLLLCTTTSLFIGLVFLNSPLSIQGLQNQMFAIFELMSIVGQLVDQQFPHFIAQRSLYEARERPAKTYSWKVFMLSQILVEIPWYTLASVLMWALFYFPVGFYKNADVASEGIERGRAHVAPFLGVSDLDQMPRFWIFLYRASPLSYYVSAILSTGLANANVTCASNEFITFDPPASQTCGEYMTEHISAAGGYLLESDTTSNCQYCNVKETNVYLAGIHADYDTRWRNFGIMWAYVAFNVAAALILYWVARMPKGKKKVSR